MAMETVFVSLESIVVLFDIIYDAPVDFTHSS